MDEQTKRAIGIAQDALAEAYDAMVDACLREDPKRSNTRNAMARTMRALRLLNRLLAF